MLDLAAGTGKLTRALAAAGSRMLAAEPMPGMVAQLRRAVPGVPVVAARAEHLPLAAGRLDGITVAQAFHWFDAPAAITEANRVLRAGGHLVLVWNKRDVSVPWVAEMSRVLDRYERLAPRGDMDRWQEAFGATDGFTPLARRAFHHEHVLPDLRDRVASMSFVLVLAEPERQALDVGDVAASLDGEEEALRRLAGPGFEALPRRLAVEGVVQLDGVEVAGIEGEVLSSGHLLGVEAASPVRI